LWSWPDQATLPLHIRQQQVLLGFVETMQLVDEENRARFRPARATARMSRNSATLDMTALTRTKRLFVSARSPRERGLAAARGP